MNNIIDLSNIQNKIKTKHIEFINKYGSILDKVMADDKLFSDIVMARLHLIATCFKNENVIDEFTLGENGPIKYIKIGKRGISNYINIETNGKTIKVNGYNYSDYGFTDDILKNNLRQEISDIDSFDWEEFAIKILDFIHEIIYERRKATEIKLNNILTDIKK